MALKAKKKRLKKSVKITILLILLATFALSLLVNQDRLVSEITGYFTLAHEPPEQDPNILSFLINYTEKPVQIGDELRWTVYQRYRLDDSRTNQYCEIDCSNLCSAKDLEYKTGYVQQWGKCMCKCSIETSE